MSVELTPIDVDGVSSLPGITKLLKKKPTNYVDISPLSTISPLTTSSTISTITTIDPYLDPLNASSIPVVITSDSPRYLSPSVKWPKKWTEPITVTFYEDLNLDPKIHRRVSKHIYFKLLDKWLYEDLIDILNYIKIVNGKPQLISSLKDYNPLSVEKDTTETVEKKTDFIQHEIFFRNDVEKILRKYVRETKTNWYDIPNNTYFVKKIIGDELLRRIKKMIQKKK